MVPGGTNYSAVRSPGGTAFGGDHLYDSASDNYITDKQETTPIFRAGIYMKILILNCTAA